MTSVLPAGGISAPKFQNLSEKQEGVLNWKKISIWTKKAGEFVSENREELIFGLAVASAIAGIVALFVFFPEVMGGITILTVLFTLAAWSMPETEAERRARYFKEIDRFR